MDIKRVNIIIIRTPARKEGRSWGTWSWNTDVSILTILICRQSSGYFRIWSQKFDFLIYEIIKYLMRSVCFPGGSEVKASACNEGDLDLIHGSGRSPGEGNGNPHQYSCLRIPWTEALGRLQPTGSQRVRHNWATSLCPFSLSVDTFIWQL